MRYCEIYGEIVRDSEIQVWEIGRDSEVQGEIDIGMVSYRKI